MKNIFLLPTDKPSRLWMTKLGNLTRCHDIRPIKEGLGNNVNIYITSDEEIKEGDWYLFNYVEIRKADRFSCNSLCKKIILTTDLRLAPDVQKIDDEFLEWFVKNPSCEYVMVQKGFADGTAWGYNFLDYKIINLKELPQFGTKEFNDLSSQYFGGKHKKEPKEEDLNIIPDITPSARWVYNKKLQDAKWKQETLEEASKNPINYTKETNGYPKIQAFYDGAKWQQERSYSETEVLQLLLRLQQTESYNNLYDWFEQFKKK